MDGYGSEALRGAGRATGTYLAAESRRHAGPGATEISEDRELRFLYSDSPRRCDDSARQGRDRSGEVRQTERGWLYPAIREYGGGGQQGGAVRLSHVHGFEPDQHDAQRGRDQLGVGLANLRFVQRRQR